LLNNLSIPDEIKEKLKAKHEDDQSHILLGEGGFLSADENVMIDAIIALFMGKNILLKGPTGAGKTKLAETLSHLFMQPMHSINCSVDLDAEALLGFKTIRQNENRTMIEFVPGPVIEAMTEGHFLYIDEINMAKPETLPILNGVLDYRRMVTNPFTSEVVKAKEGFGVIAAINEGYVGTVPLNEALKNRFVVIDVSYVQGDQLRRVLREQSVLKDEQLIDQFLQLSADLIVQAKNGQISEDAASIRALIDACDLSAYIPPARAIERAIINKLDDEREKAAIRNISETIFG
jgi:nitric oxide reductase NorQ protein